MFEHKTVFIVGAGGSRELGFPMGEQLKSEIAAKVDIRYSDGYRQTSGDRTITNAIQNAVRGSDPNPFYQSGRTLAQNMPLAISIDNYLHTHAHDEKAILMGKLGIAACILEAERASPLFTEDVHQGEVDFHKAPSTWHSTFMQMLLEGVQRSNLEGLFANVSFITFNYDRCIEHYVMQALRSYMGLSLVDAQKLTLALTVVHPYGQVGQLPWRSGVQQVPLGARISEVDLISVSSQIRTFTERVEEERTIELMHDLIFNASKVVYLGFSYGSLNMELLTLKDASPPREVYGTTLGISPANLKIISNDIVQSMGPNNGEVSLLELPPSTCNELLNDYWRPILKVRT